MGETLPALLPRREQNACDSPSLNCMAKEKGMLDLHSSLRCVCFLLLLVPLFFVSCTEEGNTDLALNSGNSPEVYVFTGRLGDLEFHIYDSLLSGLDSSQIDGYYKFTWDKPVVDYSWEIRFYLWVQMPHQISSSYPGSHWAQIKTVDDFVTYFDTVESVLSEYQFWPLRTSDPDNYIPYDKTATFQEVNTIRICTDHSIDTAEVWPPVYVTGSWPSDTAFMVNWKTDYWDHRGFKVVLIRPSTVIDY